MQRTQEKQSQSDQVTTPEVITRGGANSLKSIFTVRRLAGLSLMLGLTACSEPARYAYSLIDTSNNQRVEVTGYDTKTECEKSRKESITAGTLTKKESECKNNGAVGTKG